MAVGDSFSAGNGAGCAVSPQQAACDRTDGSYVYQLKADSEVLAKNTPWCPGSFAWEFEFNTCSGAIASEINNLHMQNAQPPYSSFLRGASLYTVTAGGNDMKFDQIVKVCIYGVPSLTSCHTLFSNVNIYLAAGSQFRQDLEALILHLYTQAQGHFVVVSPYVTFYNADVGRHWGCWLSTSLRQQLNQAVTNANSILRQNAQAHGLSFINESDLQARFNGHRFCN
ncbi:hypothetical protein MMC09_005574 [Bachmanniomyces sp. S44760]|nr:hypothetical protein [Bachmanniomyces sp. S44760]